MHLFKRVIQAGETLKLNFNFEEYTTKEFDLKLILISNKKRIELKATKENDKFIIYAPAKQTTDWKAGRWYFGLQLERIKQDNNLIDIFVIEQGQITILPSFTALDVEDMRPHAVRVLEAVEAVIEGRASKDQMGYTINNRSLSLTPINDLLNLRQKYRQEVADIENPNRNAIGKIKKVVFV